MTKKIHPSAKENLLAESYKKRGRCETTSFFIYKIPYYSSLPFYSFTNFFV